MEPDVVRLYSSSPPPLDDAGEEEEEEEFGDFGSFDGGGVTSSFSLSDFDTPTTFNQSKALEDSPPDLYIKSMQNPTVSGNNGWANDRETVRKSIDSAEKTKKELSEILTNGMMSSDLQSEDSGQNSPSIVDVQNSSPSDGHSLSNGCSESFANSDLDTSLPISLQSTDTEVHSGQDINIADVSDINQSIYQTDNLPDSINHSFHKEASEPTDTEASPQLCANSQMFTSSRDEQEAEGEQEQRENFACGDADCLDGSEHCVDIAEAETDPSMDVGLISDTQQSGDTREIYGSNAEVEVDEDNDTPADPMADEDFCEFKDATQGFADFSRTESITQEGIPEFVTAMSRCSTDDEFGDTNSLKDFKEDDELAEEAEGDEGPFCSELPPSDSFADFSSAPFGGVVVGGEESWAAFGAPEGKEDNQDSWATFGEEQGTALGEEEQAFDTSTAPSSEDLQSSTTDFGCKMQHLFRTAFPSDVDPEVSSIAEVLSLHRFLLAQDPQEQRDPSSSFAQENALVMWRHLQDIHGSHGLKFKWAGSHSNRILLDCLGIRNILFTGDKKQPMIVPMFAAGLGMLEPTKELKKSPASPALSPSAPLESGNILCTQVAPSLSINIDDGGISGLNLDYFGPVDESSSDSENDAPLPGVDPEIYKLSTAKMENNSTGRNIADAFTKLMESMERTRTTSRNPEREEKISEEAAKVISILPDLSFMKARVLMFPSILTPAANHI